jgi:hypothetical protein
MNKIIHLLAMLAILLPASLTAQSSNYSIRNMSLQLNDNQLHVQYDLIGKKTLEPVKVRLLFYDNQYRIYQPKAISPEANSFVKPGPNRSIAWDFAQDMKKIDVGLHPYLIAGDLAAHNYKMGPEAALFSLAVPGLGNYFVTDTRHQTIKPWMKTISSLGLIALGSIAANDRYRDDPELTLDDEKPWKMGDWNYKYFNSDAEFLISAGLAIWVADVVLVAIKGNHNRKLKKSILGMPVVYR